MTPFEALAGVQLADAGGYATLAPMSGYEAFVAEQTALYADPWIRREERRRQLFETLGLVADALAGLDS